MLTETGVHAAVGAVLGLLVGSFLSVLIHRLPRMLEQEWEAEGRHWAETQKAKGARFELPPPAPAISLCRPGSRCPHCHHPIAWRHKIPLCSYLGLRGRCASCHQPIGLRYPLIELACAALWAFCLVRHGLGPTGWAWCGFGAALLALAWIDWDTGLLPDAITLPLLWAGLLAAALQWTAVPVADALWGAVAGYLSLWLVYQGYKLLTGKDGMGHGDFKLMSALGAWLGWQALLPMTVMASALGLCVGLGLILRKRLHEGGYIPFGPCLAGAGLVAMVFGTDAILQGLFAFAGIPCTDTLCAWG